MTQPSIDDLVESGRFDDALAIAKERLDAARASGDDAALARALLDEASAQLAHGDRDDAVMTVDEAISRARRAAGPNDPSYADALEIGAEIAAAAAMPHTAEARFRTSIEVLVKAGVAGASLANALIHQGLFRLQQGDAGGAARSFMTVLNRVSEPGAELFVAMALTELGFISLAAGADAKARALGDRALEVLLLLGRARRFEVADAMTLVGVAALGLKEPQVAEDFLEPACEIYRGCKGNVHARHALACYQRAHALAALGRIEDAKSSYRAALDLHREGSDARLVIEQELLELARRGESPPPAQK